MGRPQNIFYKLITDEDHYTDLLCNMLFFEATRKVFEDMLKMGQIKPELIETRTVTEENGNPDIVYQDDDKAILIEVKTSYQRDLTRHQPVSYLKQLESMDGSNKKLFFLMPIGYPHLEKIYGRLEKAGRDRSAITVLYWEDFYEALSKVQNLDFVEHQFLNVLKNEFEYGEVSMADEERDLLFKKDIWVALEHIRKIIRNAHMELKKEDLIKVDALKCEEGSKKEEGEDFGFYVLDAKGKQAFWAGKWEPIARETGCALAIGASKDNSCYKFFVDELKGTPGYRYIGLTDVKPGESVEKAFINLIKTMYANVVQ